MKLTVERGDLAAAMSRVGGIVAGKAITPILSSVLLTTDGDRLTIRATNLDMEALETIAATVEIEGAAVVPASTLNDIARNLPPGAMVGLEMIADPQGERLAVKSGRSRFKLGVLNPNAFPALWAAEWPVQIEMNSDKLLFLLRRAAFAQSAEAGKFHLMGVHIAEIGGKFRAHSANGYMAGYYDGDPVEPFTGVTIPTKMVNEMDRLLGQVEGVARLGISDTKMNITVGDVSITSKLIDPSFTFPLEMLQQHFAAPKPRGAVINVATLTASLRRVMISASGGKTVTVRFSFSPGVLALSGRNTALDTPSEALDEIEIDYDGEEIMMGFNPAFVLDTLSALDCEQVAVAFDDKTKPTLWRSTVDANGTALIVPQRVV